MCPTGTMWRKGFLFMLGPESEVIGTPNCPRPDWVSLGLTLLREEQFCALRYDQVESIMWSLGRFQVFILHEVIAS